jgi:hypothetical protein
LALASFWSCRDAQPAQQPDSVRHVYRQSNNYSTPPHASQPDGTDDIDTGDTRISGTAMYNAGSIYASPFVSAGGANDGQIAGARILNDVAMARQGPGRECVWTANWYESDDRARARQ